jgi:glutamyl-Q tRNA(Asp) synthetase
VAALASFLQARCHHAPWYLRIEDLDAPRTVRGAVDSILRTLDAYGLYWDGPILYQSDRTPAYAAALQTLSSAGHTFPCACTRREAITGPPGVDGPIYAGRCRNGLQTGRRPHSVRLRAPERHIAFTDRGQGRHAQTLARDVGDFILRRSDGYFAYQLAVVVDDAYQGVREVVRGADLLTSTPRQIYLQQLLGLGTPYYLHVPVLLDARGKKLSKRDQAPCLSMNDPGPTLHRALHHLGQKPPPELASAASREILSWGMTNWRAEIIPHQTEICL